MTFLVPLEICEVWGNYEDHGRLGREAVYVHFGRQASTTRMKLLPP
jgi:hypothetical protein